MKNHSSLAPLQSQPSTESESSFAAQSNELSQGELIPQKEVEPSWIKVVVLPGMLGGLTKSTMDFITPSRTEVGMSAIVNQVMPDSPAPSLVILMSANIFLGAISAMIGSFVLSDLLDFQKSMRKIFGLSLVFGLSFSLVLEAATSRLSFESEISSLEVEKTQLQDMLLSSIIDEISSPTDQMILLQNIRLLADEATSLYVQEKAVQSMAVLANRTKDLEVKASALKCLARIANKSSNQTIQTGAVLAMEAIAMKSNQRALKTRSIEELELLKTHLEPEAVTTLEQAIKHLKG